MLKSFDFQDSMPLKIGEKYKYNLVDDDFEEQFVGTMTSEGMDVLSGIIEVYEKRNISPAGNIIKFINFTMKKYDMKISQEQYLNNISKQNKKFLKYKNQVEKLMVLI